jgi:hypothetical protein
MKNWKQSTFVGFLAIIAIVFAFICCGGRDDPISPTSVEIFAESINNWTGEGTGSLNTVVNGNIVTVTGNITEVTGTNRLDLNISEGVTVKWEASLSGNNNTLINLRGKGTLEISSGGSIIQTQDHGTAISIDTDSILKVTGGSVSNFSSIGTTIRAAFGGNIIISDGEVMIAGNINPPISISQNTNLTVTGGIISGGGGTNVSVSTDHTGAINISGGKMDIIFVSGKGTITLSGNPDIGSGKISRHSSDEYVTVTVIGYYSDTNTKAMFGDSWTEGVNLFRME